MKAIKIHYGLLFLSCILCASVFVLVIVQDQIAGSFDFGYLDYLLPISMFILVLSLYYSLFKWNKRANQQKSSDLFWVIILLGVIVTIIGVTNTTEGFERVFAVKKEDSSYVGLILDTLFDTKKTQQEIVIEKILFYTFSVYTVLLVIILFLTIYIRVNLKRSIAGAE